MDLSNTQGLERRKSVHLLTALQKVLDEKPKAKLRIKIEWIYRGTQSVHVNIILLHYIQYLFCTTTCNEHKREPSTSRTSHPVHTRVSESQEKKIAGLFQSDLKTRQVQPIMREQGQQLERLKRKLWNLKRKNAIIKLDEPTPVGLLFQTFTKISLKSRKHRWAHHTFFIYSSKDRGTLTEELWRFIAGLHV